MRVLLLSDIWTLVRDVKVKLSNRSAAARVNLNSIVTVIVIDCDDHDRVVTNDSVTETHLCLDSGLWRSSPVLSCTVTAPREDHVFPLNYRPPNQLDKTYNEPDHIITTMADMDVDAPARGPGPVARAGKGKAKGKDDGKARFEVKKV